MKVYKGTDKNMQCREFQYELGKTVKDDGAVRCGNKGFHSCEAPLDVLRYYPMRDGNRYFAAEADGVIDRAKNEDSKIASSELTLKTEISVKDLIKAHFEFTRKKAESGIPGVRGCRLHKHYCRAQNRMRRVCDLVICRKDNRQYEEQQYYLYPRLQSRRMGCGYAP